MNNSTLFKQAHALTRKTMRAGDSYSVTFSACLKQVIADNKRAIKANAKTIFQSLLVAAVIAFVVFLGVSFNDYLGAKESKQSALATELCSQSDTKWIKLAGDMQVRYCKDYR